MSISGPRKGPRRSLPLEVAQGIASPRFLGRCRALFESSMRYKEQYVTIGDLRSYQLRKPIRRSQVSFFGPSFFIVFINDSPQKNKSSRFSYADGSQIKSDNLNPQQVNAQTLSDCRLVSIHRDELQCQKGTILNIKCEERL